ncbi:MAG: hypothetical protein Q8M15_16860 [Bacteroidota bacterium]|nr:hypothetical protein [Bacteroidota bacterium]
MTNKSKKSEQEKPKLKEELVKSHKPDIEKGRDLGKSEWVNENTQDNSYRPNVDDAITPPKGDDSE